MAKTEPLPDCVRHDGRRNDGQPDDGTAPAPASAEGTAVGRLELNPADCCLDFYVGGGGLRGYALHEGIFGYCWSGARATVGVRGGGKYCFGCKLVAEQPVSRQDTPADEHHRSRVGFSRGDDPVGSLGNSRYCFGRWVVADQDVAVAADQRHLCRVGVSRGDEPVGSLGESIHSFGFGGTGNLSHMGKFFDYGVKFGVGDTIVCAVDLDSKPLASIGFSKNGEWLGIVQNFDSSDKGLGLVDAPVRPLPWESALFPHVTLKNFIVEMQFSKEDGLLLPDGYEPWSLACADGNAVFGPIFAEQEECEVIMMVGLPGSGKSTWAEKWVKEHPEKRYVILGTDLAMIQLKLTQQKARQSIHIPSVDWDQAARSVTATLLRRAPTVRRNYIIDLSNLDKISRIRMLGPFTNHLKTAIVVFPMLNELKTRAAKQCRGTSMKAWTELIGQLTASFELPQQKDVPASFEAFDRVIYVEQSQADAHRILDRMKHFKTHGEPMSTASGALLSEPWVSLGYERPTLSQLRIQAMLNAPRQYLVTSANENQPSSNAAELQQQPIHTDSAKDKPPDEDLIMSKTFDLMEEYELMDSLYDKITERSKNSRTSETLLKALWKAFNAKLKRCRAIRRDIRKAGGAPYPIPERFLE